MKALVRWISDRRIMIEIFLVVAVAVSAMLNYAGVRGADQSLMVVMSTLAIFYFLSSYLERDRNSTIITIAIKAVAIFSSTGVIGILFAILHLTGATEMVMVASVSLAVAGGVLLIYSISSRDSRFIPLLLRVLILGGICAATLLTLSPQNG